MAPLKMELKMIIDKENLFSEHQAITASAASTNSIDMGAEGAYTPTPNDKNIDMNIQVTEDFNNLTSLKVGVQTDSDSAFGSAVTLVESTILLADLKAGYKFPLIKLPEGCSRYVRLYYTVAGAAPTTGKMHSALVFDRQTNS